jgi:hypothetical protein
MILTVKVPRCLHHAISPESELFFRQIALVLIFSPVSENRPKLEDAAEQLRLSVRGHHKTNEIRLVSFENGTVHTLIDILSSDSLMTRTAPGASS